MSRFEQVRSILIGQDIHDVPQPAIILDVAVARRHCRSMLSAVKTLGVGFGAHVKTHKNDESRDAKFITSTVAEIEHLLPLLMDYQAKGRKVNILDGIPLPASAASRLAKIALKLGPGTVSVLIDHVSQLSSLAAIFAKTQSPISIYIKVDTGYHRAGLPPTALNTGGLLGKLLELEAAAQVTLLGLYSHSSLSYTGTSPRRPWKVSLTHSSMLAGTSRELTISVGASPQAVSMQNFAETVADLDENVSQLRQKMQQNQPTSHPLGARPKHPDLSQSCMCRWCHVSVLFAIRSIKNELLAQSSSTNVSPE
ncbi:hypothetical protein EDB81DRAFT_908253 [Dactylonectria macrodidyma]|uniref:Alanine racemase N-terminal domain-containing protein n=1 Tax=Dactylonectria macrodidyma TaxID=307937 RepID=A0A9P9FQG0_9HYPO|nr:hypothetical protein EDB81DRAFT_908253 [Dactylonectria macrodidyma]